MRRNTQQTRLATALFSLAWLLAPSPVVADEMEAGAGVTVPDASQTVESQAMEYKLPIQEDHEDWRYSTDYLFPLTRGLSSEDLSTAGRVALYPLLGLVDVGQLPFGLIGGLFGS